MRNFLVYLLPTFLVAALLIYYIKPLTHRLGNFIHPRVDATQVVGKAQEIIGRVTIKRHQQKKYSAIQQGESVYNYDRIQVANKSSLILNFPSGYSLKFSENSEFVLELWDNQKPQLPTYIYLNHGQHKMLKKGLTGSLYILKDNRQFTPEQKIPARTPLETLPPNSFPPSISQATTSQSPKGTKKNPTLRKQDFNNLSDEYIEKKVSQQISLFEDCLVKGLSEDGVATGNILVGFSILPTGKTTDVKAINSQLNSEKLKSCVLDVFKRMRFKSFQGETIPFSYPLDFK